MKAIKKLALIAITVVLLTVCFIFGASALEPTGQCGENVYWSFDKTTGELVISGTGEVYNDDEIINGSYFDTPFKNCNDILTVIIEDNITSIGSYMFYNCTNLSEVNIGSSVSIIFNSAFANCTSLESITIPSNVTEIKDNAFYRCSSLKELNLSEGLKTIGEATFKYCGRIKELFIPNSVIQLGDSIFEDSCIESVVIGNGINNIPHLAFGYCSLLKSIEFGNTTEYINSSAFHCCHSLNVVNFKDSIKAIYSSAFNECENIKEVYYNGTKDHWNSIVINSSNSYLLSADIHYNIDDTYTAEIESEATCYYDGQEKITCSHGNSYYKVIPQKEHSEKYVSETPSTCMVNGTTEGKVCSLCGDVLEGCEIIPTIAHNLIYSVVKDPTCTEDGEGEFRCLYYDQCGYTEFYPIYASGHNYDEWTQVTNATCEGKGIEKRVCTNDGTHVEMREVDVLGHSYLNGVCIRPDCGINCTHNWKSGKCKECNLTCQHIGGTATCIKKSICTICGEKYGDFCTTNHVSLDTVIKNIKEATCTEFGYTGDEHYYCCDTIKTVGSKIEKLNHEHLLIDSKEPNCTEDGYCEYSCVNCGDLRIDIIPATNVHFFTCLKPSDATCTTDGHAEYGCIYCDYKYTETISAYGHSMDYFTETNPTCTENGTRRYGCFDCDYTYTETIPATGHNYPDDWSVLVEPDCETKGINVKICLNCNALITQKLPKAGHADKDGDSKCDTCDKEIIVIEPDEPTEPDTPEEPDNNDEEKPCSCDCHAGGIKAFFFKLINFFVKIFDKSARVCECGKSH